MSSTGDQSSAVFSMHSRAATRASTVASSLLPPMSEIGPSKYSYPDMTGLRTLNTGRRINDAPLVRSRSPNTAGSRSARSRSPLEYGPEPFEEYCSPTRSATSGLTDLQRHRSTKQLINRYEAMETSALPSRSPRTPVRETARTTAAVSPAHVRTLPAFRSGMKSNKTSPMRHSFRNFLSVFTKSKHPIREETVWTPTTERMDVIHHTTPKTSSDDPFIVPNIMTKDLMAEKIACNTPTALRSGPLLYLSQCSTNPLASLILPVWTSCTATLHRKHILITWLSQHGNPSTHIIDLTSCADVRSLALSQISADEQALLPDKGAGLKVFVIQFEGNQKEKFACSSVQDRAGWISAIWNVILQTQEEVEGDAVCQQPDNSNFPGALTIATDLPVPNISATAPVYEISDAQTTPSTLRTNLGTSVYSNRSLPPTPTSLTATRPGSPFPERLSLHDSPRGRSPLSDTTSRTVSPSHLSPGARSRSKSPSIANLGHLSVVKQRLAQIENDPSRSPTSSPTLSRKSTRTRELSPLSPASMRTAFGGAGDWQRLHSLRHDTGSNASVSSKSPPIVDNYDSREVHPPKAESASKHEHFEPSRLYLSSVDPQLDESCEVSRGPDALSKEAVPTGEASNNEFKETQDKLYDIRRQVNSQTGDPPIGIVQTLAEMQAQLKSDLPEMMAKLQEIKAIREGGDLIDDSLPGNVLNNIGRSIDIRTLPLDLTDIQAKLDMLLSIRQPDDDKLKQIITSPSIQAERELRSTQALELSAQMNELLSRARSGEARQSVQSEQQVDNIRYLNELNVWLEMFVNSGTSQIQIVASAVQRLCEELGCNDEHLNPSRVLADVGHKSGILADIQQLLLENKNRDQHIEALRAAVDGLVDVVHEDVRQNAEARDKMTIQSIMDLINRQRHEHDHMLMGISTKLTNEIRGERLRFVDAMKEATEINVQAHVEQFKKELTREVLVMTQDVGRLHKERQAIEQQIAELFAFYSKQKQSSPKPTARRGPSQPLAQFQQNVAPPPPSGRRSSQRRPLPNPLNPWNQ